MVHRKQVRLLAQRPRLTGEDNGAQLGFMSNLPVTPQGKVPLAVGPNGAFQVVEASSVAATSFAPPQNNQLPLQGQLKTCSPLAVSTVGLRNFYHHVTHSRASSVHAAEKYQLSDGRLDLGGHLPRLAQRYKYVGTLAEGISAQVIQADDAFRYGKRVVIKVIKRQFTECALQEVSTMRCINALDVDDRFHLGRLLDSFSFQGNMCLVLERLHTRLSDVHIDAPLMSDKRVLMSLVRKVAIQLFTTFAFLDTHDYVHADLKPDNILLRCPWQHRGTYSVPIKVIDLGNAFRVSQANAFYDDFEVQALAYRAPEVLLGLPFDGKIDMWSIGCILVELALQKPAFSGIDRRSMLDNMIELLGWPDWKDIRNGKFSSDVWHEVRRGSLHVPQARSNILLSYREMQCVRLREKGYRINRWWQDCTTQIEILRHL